VISINGAGDAGQDVCYREHQNLAAAGDFFTDEIVTGVAIGALVGGLAGALTGGGSNVGERVLVGAAAGAAIGGVGGYLAAKQREHADRMALMASVHSDLVRENEEIDRATVAFAKARECRVAAAAQVKADYKAGRLSRAEAEARLQRLKRQHDDDIAVAEALSANMAKRAESFRHASKELTGIEAAPAAPAPAIQLQALARDAKVRSKRDGKSPVLASLKRGALVEVVGAPDDRGWVEVVLNGGRTGFVPAADFGEVKRAAPQPVVVAKEVPVSETGIVELTSTSQLKQAGFAQSVQQAQADAPLFELASETSAATAAAPLG